MPKQVHGRTLRGMCTRLHQLPHLLSRSKPLSITLPLRRSLFLIFFHSNSNQDACSAYTCNNHGTCNTDKSGNAYCDCQTQYAGDHCDSCKTGYINYPSCTLVAVCTTALLALPPLLCAPSLLSPLPLFGCFMLTLFSRLRARDSLATIWEPVR